MFIYTRHNLVERVYIYYCEIEFILADLYRCVNGGKRLCCELRGLWHLVNANTDLFYDSSPSYPEVSVPNLYPLAAVSNAKF